METQHSTQRLPMFHGTRRDDEKKHWFTCEACEAIWFVKRVTNKASIIA